MTFAKPIFLYSLILVPMMALFMLWAKRRRQAALARLGNPTLVRRLSSTVNWRGRRWRNGLWLLTLTMLIVSWKSPI
jgi:hypothetical protein